jgi:hypothetical protein
VSRRPGAHFGILLFACRFQAGVVRGRSPLVQFAHLSDVDASPGSLFGERRQQLVSHALDLHQKRTEFWKGVLAAVDFGSDRESG